MRYLMMFLMFFVAAVAAQAEEAQPAGARMTLSATATAEYPNDEVVVSFRVEKDGRDAGRVLADVNRISAAIEQRLRHQSGLKYRTTGRNMQPLWQYPKDGKRIRSGWQVSQGGQIVSTRLEAVSSWLEAIESEGAMLSSLQFDISADASKHIQQQLQLDAIASFRAQAAGMARGMGAKSFRVIRINSSSQMPPMPAPRSAMVLMSRAAADMAPPSLSAGESRVTVAVEGEIEIPFHEFPVN
ncbi:DUF541 domain-containing protein [Mariprofundus erugo]|uniref:DUF541 domain-containing protein n=1 Tax=Mariprofundus erugo TaxID=2528639 RepID=A0A5R9GVC8_9PROT|nr:SIMPL domain-containing protein [Mariprofundus erugo]TLS68117.1 DUF541 domain-containing protein [Mariprofundus erugo]